MKAHLSIVAGLIVGVAIAGLVLGGLVALAPEPPPVATPSPPPVATPSPPLAIATASPSAATSTPPSGSPSASAGASTGPFHIGQPAAQLVVPQVGDATAAATWEAVALPVHFWIDADGIGRDGALGGIRPDIMATGLKTILPGVDVTP